MQSFYGLSLLYRNAQVGVLSKKLNEPLAILFLIYFFIYIYLIYMLYNKLNYCDVRSSNFLNYMRNVANSRYI